MDSTSALLEQLTILISSQITQRNKMDDLRSELEKSQKIIDQKDTQILELDNEIRKLRIEAFDKAFGLEQD